MSYIRIVFLLFLIGMFPPFISLSFGADYDIRILGEHSRSESRRQLLYTILDAPSMNFRYTALSVIIDLTLKEPRGKIQAKTIRLSAQVMKESEFIKLFIHEIGHYVDIYFFAKTPSGDISDIFYTISWQDATTKKAGQGLRDFVSGYAATSKYEDFAESFTFYIFHNREFIERAMKNDALRQKYAFFANYTFPSGSFSDTDFSIARVPEYFWDTTKLQISPQKYLYSLQ